MRYFNGVLRLLMVVTCIFSSCSKTPPHVKALELSLQAFNKVDGLPIKVVSSGSYSDREKLTTPYVDYQMFFSPTFDQSHNLLHHITERFIQHLNEDINLREFIKEPITSKEISLSISFNKENGGISRVCLIDGMEEYFTFDATEQEHKKIKSIPYRNLERTTERDTCLNTILETSDKLSFEKFG